MENLYQANWNSRKKSVKLSTGITMKYIEMGNFEGEKIVMLHGYADTSRSWSVTAPFLLEKYHLYMPDLRGFGDTDKPEMRTYPLALFAEDVKAYMNVLKIEKASFIGHSMGSFISRIVAITYPELVDKLILIGTSHTLVNTPVASELWSLINTFETNPINRVLIEELVLEPQPIDRELEEQIVTEACNLPVHVWKAALRGIITDDHCVFLKDITAPVMILWGMQDPLFSEQDQKEIRKFLPDAKFITFPEAGHSLHYQEPEKTTVYIKEFLYG